MKKEFVVGFFVAGILIILISFFYYDQNIKINSENGLANFFGGFGGGSNSNGESTCGNGICEYPLEEDFLNCPDDCDKCGNGICVKEKQENYFHCPDDCATCNNNDYCDYTETEESCPGDCKPLLCGDGICEGTEDPNNCPQDCSSNYCAPLRTCYDFDATYIVNYERKKDPETGVCINTWKVLTLEKCSESKTCLSSTSKSAYRLDRGLCNEEIPENPICEDDSLVLNCEKPNDICRQINDKEIDCGYDEKKCEKDSDCPPLNPPPKVCCFRKNINDGQFHTGICEGVSFCNYEGVCKIGEGGRLITECSLDEKCVGESSGNPSCVKKE